MQSTLLKNSVVRFIVGTAAVIGVALLGMSTERGPVSADPELVAGKTTTQADDETRRKIVETAEKEMNSKRNYETGENCNAYSPGGACQAWCADFAKYVWSKGGAKTDGVNSGARSFKTYGQKNKTWKNGAGPKNVKAGDAVTYRLNDKYVDNDHVGIVTKVDKKTGKITVISGNSTGGKIRKITIDPKKSQVTGYASPVEKKSAKKAKGDDGKSAEKANKDKPTKAAEQPKSEKKAPEKKDKVTKTDKKTQGKKAKDDKPGQVEPEGPVVLSEAQVTVSTGVLG